jgi:predicted DNA-binding protein (MmcQ/YjbR family)
MRIRWFGQSAFLLSGSADTDLLLVTHEHFDHNGADASVTTAEPLDISVKCDPDLAAALRRDYDAIAEGYHLNKRHWITVTLNGDAPDDMVQGLIEDSYALVMSAAARSRR